MESTSPPEDLSISFNGQYDFVVTEEKKKIKDSQKRVDVTWKFNDKKAKQSNRNHQLHGDIVKMLRPRLQTSVGTTVTGYTKAVISCLGIRTPFYAHPCFHGCKYDTDQLEQFVSYWATTDVLRYLAMLSISSACLHLDDT